jgi:UDP-sugar transporter A1/2/3
MCKQQYQPRCEGQGKQEPDGADLKTQRASDAETSLKPASGQVSAYAHTSNSFMVFLFLTALVIQNVGLATCSRYSRLGNTGGPSWLNTTAVFISELMKVVASLILVIIESWDAGPRKSLHRIFVADAWSFLLMGVPGLLYTLQNNLYFVGISNLSVGLFQVVSQLKIVSTAICTVLLLRRQISGEKWLAVLMLTGGVMLIVSRDDSSQKSQGVMALGLVAVICACITSGIAGVFLEKMLKDSKATIWERNLQLSMFGVVFGLAGVSKDLDTVRSGGFFQGYNELVVGIILLQAGGGLVVAAVLKYADNVLKCFGVAVSVIAGAVLSRVLHSEGPPLTDPALLCGIIVILWAMLLYGLGSEKLRSIFIRTASEDQKLGVAPSRLLTA